MDYLTTHDAEGAYQALLRRGVNFEDTAEFLPGTQKLLAEIHAQVQPEETESAVEGETKAWWQQAADDIAVEDAEYED